jgi:hypothetical protein
MSLHPLTLPDNLHAEPYRSGTTPSSQRHVTTAPGLVPAGCGRGRQPGCGQVGNLAIRAPLLRHYVLDPLMLKLFLTPDQGQCPKTACPRTAG